MSKVLPSKPFAVVNDRGIDKIFEKGVVTVNDQQQSQLTAENLNANRVLVVIENKKRHPALSTYSTNFAELKSSIRVINSAIYLIINIRNDVFLERWDDFGYSTHLRSLLSEQDWMQFKRDILHIYEEHNAKRAALRALIEFNCFRSLSMMFSIALIDYSNAKLYCHPPHCWFCCYRTNPWMDPLSDQQPPMSLLFCLFMPLGVVSWLMYIIVIFFGSAIISGVLIVLDLLFLPRFCLFYYCHKAFLESVMTAHPELNPSLLEEEFISQMDQLIESFSSLHPALHCRIDSSVKHVPRNGSNVSYDMDHFQIKFFKFAPEWEA